MLKVYSVLWGDKYSSDYVYRLRNAVGHYLTVPHEFICVTDHKLYGIHTIKPIVDWSGWWQKLSLFELADGPSLYFDLDVVITGSLNYLQFFTDSKFSAPKNWAKSGYGGIQSSVMAWDGTWKEPAKRFNYEVDGKVFWGDQEFLTHLLGSDFEKIPKVYSFKYHCNPSSYKPHDSSVICFHGKPDYHEVDTLWIKDYIQSFTPTQELKTRG